MKIVRGEYPEGQTWSFVRSDGALKTYIVTNDGIRSSVVQKAGKVLEMRYKGKVIA